MSPARVDRLKIIHGIYTGVQQSALAVLGFLLHDWTWFCLPINPPHSAPTLDEMN